MSLTMIISIIAVVAAVTGFVVGIWKGDLLFLYSGVGVAAILLVLSGPARSAEEAKAEDTALRERVAAYNLDLIKREDDHFVATDKETGKTVRCSFTEDQKTLVCNNALIQKSK